MAILAPDPEPVVESPPIMEREPTSEAPTPPLGRPVSMYKNAFSKEPKDVALGNVLVAIRKLVTRIHRMAPALAGHDLATIEKRLQEEESDIVAQLRIVDDRVNGWRQAE